MRMPNPTTDRRGSTASPRRLALCIAAAALQLGASAEAMRPTQSRQSIQPGEPAAAVAYEIDLADRAGHEARIAMRVTLAPEGARIDPAALASGLRLVMSRSSPGRYATHDFAKNVYDVEAVDQRGWKLPLDRLTPHEWRVDLASAPSEVTFRYTLYADRCDGTYSAIDRSHAHLNAPATFVWARGFEGLPHDVRLELPRGWRVSTQLPHRRDGRAFRAMHLAELLDSPIEASDHLVRGFTLPASGEIGAQEILVALHHQGDQAEATSFVHRVEAVVLETVAVFGEPPRFDHGRYTFLADYLPWCRGDGMEHRNSTVLTSSASLARSAERLLGTVAHEFVHAWNVERMRPASLEPFDFERANMSDALWFGEGFTSYYDRLLLKRAGVYSLPRFADRIGGVVDAVLRSPAVRRTSPVAASRQAPFVDAATANDPSNRENTFLSYYTWGAGVGLALDLSLRERLEGGSLDGFLQLVWSQHSEIDRPYEIEDLERLLGDYSGDPTWAQDFFARFVHDGNAPDYFRLLGQAGLRLRRADQERAWLGVEVEPAEQEEAGLLVVGNPLDGSPAAEAGLARGDRLVRLGGQEIGSLAEFEAALAERRPGDPLRLSVEGRGEEFEVEVRLAGDPGWEVVPYEELGLALTPQIERFRDAWLAPRRTLAESSRAALGTPRR